MGERVTRVIPKTATRVLLVCLFVSGGLGAQSNGTLAERVQKVVDRPEFKHATFGIEFYSLDTGKTLFKMNADKLFVPGSTTKLLTEGTALKLLGADYRFHTRVYRTGPIGPDGTLDGDLVLVASGDPNLSGRIESDGTLAFENVDHSYASIEEGRAVPGDPLAVINELAQQAGHKIKQIKGRVFVDTSFFPEGKREAGTGVVVSPIAVNDNIIDVIVVPGAKEGEQITLKASPETSYVRFINHATMGKPGSDRELAWTSDVANSDGARTVTLEGTVPADKPPAIFPYSVPTPSRFAEIVLAEALGRAGVTVAVSTGAGIADFKRLAQFYTPENVVAEHISPPLKQEVKITLKVSQNLHATMTPLILGATLGRKNDDPEQAGLDLEHDFLQKAGLDLTGASQQEGAGGPGAYFTPDFMVHFLAYMAKQKDFHLFFDALPILGRDGTLWNVQVKSPAAGRVHAKTGTFANYDALNHRLTVSGKGLAGYVETKDGRKLAFAAYVNNVSTPLDFKAVEKVGDVLGEIAAAAYDAPPER